MLIGGRAGRSGCDAGQSGDKAKVMVAGVTALLALETATYVGVDGCDREGGSDEASKASDKLEGSEDDLWR
jgi:hypothetical protein